MLFKHFKVLSAEVNEFGVTLKKNQNEINKIEMDFKFVNMVLTSTLSSYRDFNNHPDVTMHVTVIFIQNSFKIMINFITCSYHIMIRHHMLDKIQINGWKKMMMIPFLGK